MKAAWSSTQYLLFENQRNQPAIDLIKRISDFKPDTIADLGCGPGNSTRLLKQAFPCAKIVGIDNSENMMERQSLFTKLNEEVIFCFNRFFMVGVK